MRYRWLGPFAVAVACAGCAPALDWREVRVAEDGLTALFPCKPVSQSRELALAGATVRLVLMACAAGDATWALASADMVDPALVQPALVELLATTVAKLAAAPQALPLQVPGATPNEHSQRVQLDGQLGNGKTQTSQVAVFAKGTRVFQATLLGGRWSKDDADSFFSGFRFSP